MDNNVYMGETKTQSKRALDRIVYGSQKDVSSTQFKRGRAEF
jgi:hypothetical protein